MKTPTTTRKAGAPSKLPPIHPGEVLREDFMRPLGLSMNALALTLRVPVPRIAEIVHERRSITPDTALRLARYFNTSARFWINLQASYDLEVAEDKVADEIARHVQPRAITEISAEGHPREPKYDEHRKCRSTNRHP